MSNILATCFWGTSERLEIVLPPEEAIAATMGLPLEEAVARFTSPPADLSP